MLQKCDQSGGDDKPYLKKRKSESAQPNDGNDPCKEGGPEKATGLICRTLSVSSDSEDGPVYDLEIPKHILLTRVVQDEQ